MEREESRSEYDDLSEEMSDDDEQHQELGAESSFEEPSEDDQGNSSDMYIRPCPHSLTFILNFLCNFRLSKLC